ncbi:MAG: XRE family transcriptional regulator [Proteobacteria bacterium]|nr:XRE family transcriptional regulator [Pseudomonadota bacterium]MBU1451912.1 XRE family transcriptional regulator [Pseudomonadota bacterium]MBU2469567.1 XRE family transcriptional regulator [Pseudomonadota bacterium]MBU2518218.1 XRE family transcriptional regulator [Pseudomonadota bacterium]
MNLGTLLRHHRNSNRLTLKAVAEKTGVSEGFLSQVENNVKSPSVGSLMKICEAIGVNPGDVLDQLQNQEDLFLIRQSEWTGVEIPHTGFATRRFCPPEVRNTLDSAVLFIEPGSAIPVRKNLKNGQEVLCLLQGTLELVHGDKAIRMVQGDAVHLWSQPERQMVSNQGQELAVVLWVGTM